MNIISLITESNKMAMLLSVSNKSYSPDNHPWIRLYSYPMATLWIFKGKNIGETQWTEGCNHTLQLKGIGFRKDGATNQLEYSSFLLSSIYCFNIPLNYINLNWFNNLESMEHPHLGQGTWGTHEDWISCSEYSTSEFCILIVIFCLSS